MNQLDPNETPVEDGQEQGQPGQESQVSEEPQVDPVAEKLRELEEQNKNLHYKLTQQGRKLKQYEEVAPPRTQEPAAEEFDWQNPGASIGKYVSKALGDFENRQEQRRQAEEMIRRTAEDRGIPVPKLQEYYVRLQEAAQDPYELMDTVARMYQADHAQEAISQAARTAQETAQRNARAVTTESSSTQPIEPHKSLKEMTDEELEKYVQRKYGVADWPT
jgi:hypothetical protein